jgi:hypothetical protein
MFRRLGLITVLGAGLYLPAVTLASGGHSHYAPPPQHYAPPPQHYAPPPQHYAPPPQHYAPPPQHYASPPQHYAPPPRHHEPPPQHHEPPPQHYTPPQQHHEPPPQHYTPPSRHHEPPPQHTNPPIGHGGAHPPVTGGTHPPHLGTHPGHGPQNPYRGTYVPPAGCERHDGYYRGKRYFPGPYCARRGWLPTLWFFLPDSNVWSCPESNLIQTDPPDLAGEPFTVVVPEQTYQQIDDGTADPPVVSQDETWNYSVAWDDQHQSVGYYDRDEQFVKVVQVPETIEETVWDEASGTTVVKQRQVTNYYVVKYDEEQQAFGYHDKNGTFVQVDP